MNREDCFIYNALLVRARSWGHRAAAYARAGRVAAARSYATSAAESYFATHGRAQ